LLDSRILDFDAQGVGCGVGGWEKFTAQDPSAPAKQSKSASAERRRLTH